ncbi:hypothetical protein CASFOL_016181 [Castilleja foliolosa]|uniref:Uncharacterized protein n=1 Tax=Castilleja foliolosa TaxID=1961234 RepID=A0ABD3DG71_9LAMI
MNNRFNNHQFAGELEDTEYSPENSGGDSPCSAVSPPILHPLSGGGVAVDQGLGNCHNNYLLSELMLMSNCPSKIRDDEDEEIEKMKLEQHLSYAATAVSRGGNRIGNSDFRLIRSDIFRNWNVYLVSEFRKSDFRFFRK